MGVRVGDFPLRDSDHFIAVVKPDKENPDTVQINVSDLARKMQKVQKDLLEEFLKSEGIFEDNIGIFVGLDLPKDYETRNILLDYFKKLNETRREAFEQEQIKQLNAKREKIGLPIKDKPSGVKMFE